jgi:hypothetical protein
MKSEGEEHGDGKFDFIFRHALCHSWKNMYSDFDSTKVKSVSGKAFFERIGF